MQKPQKPKYAFNVLCAFWVVDAQMEWVFRRLSYDQLPNIQTRLQRKALSTGSAQFSFSVNKSLIARWEIRALSEHATRVETFVFFEGETSLETINEQIHTILKDAAELNDNPKLDSLTMQMYQMEQRLINQVHQLELAKQEQAQISQEIEALSRPAQPKRGDSLDEWLDYRELEAKRHNKITLQHIATEGGFTLISVKRASAERIRRGDKD